MDIKLNGGDKWKKVLASLSGQSPALKIGILSGATAPNGRPVAEYAFYNEFGATIKMPERSQTLRFKKTKSGALRFAKASAKRVAKETAVTVKAHVIHIPARPFMRNTVKEHTNKWADGVAGRLKARVTEKGMVEKAFRLLGEEAKGDIIATIKAGVNPPNSPASIRRKGADKPTLIDTGDMLKSIDYKLLKRGEK